MFNKDAKTTFQPKWQNFIGVINTADDSFVSY